MRRPWWLLVVTLVVIAPGAAPADDNKTQATAAFAEAKDRYGAGDYAAAAKLFARAYELDPDPAYLFNVAQSYRLADDCVKAADYYQQFLARVPNPPNLDAVEGWLDDAKKCAATRVVKPAHPEPPPPSPPPSPPQPPPHSAGGTRVLPIVAIGAGVVALAAGGFFAWDTSHIAGQKNDLTTRCNAAPTTMMPRCGATESAQLDDFDHRGHRARILAISGFAAGGIALAAGVWLWQSHRSERPVAVAPVQGGAVLATAFSF